MHSPADSPRTSKTVKRLWLCGVALLAFVGTVAVGNAFLPEDKRLTARMVGHDFLAFYTAGEFVRTGRIHDLYELPKVQAYQHELAKREGLEIGQSYGPFWNPPFYAWVFVPISALPYRAALGTWWGVNGVGLGVALFLMMRVLRGNVKHEDMKHEEGRDAGRRFGRSPGGSAPACSPPSATGEGVCLHPSAFLLHPSRAPWSVVLLVPLLVVTTMPFVQAFSHGQNTFTSLALLAGAVAAWRSGRAVLAGAVAGLLMYKPQLGAVVSAALVLSMGWRALIGLTITGSVLAGVTLLTMPGVLADYERLLPVNLRQFQVQNVYLWDRHVTLRAFCRLLIQGRETGEIGIAAKLGWFSSCAIVAGGLLTAWWRTRKAATPAVRDAFISAVIVGMPLLMPFYFDYDLLLLSVPAVLCARRAIEAGRANRAVFWAWAGLVAWVIVNSSVARVTGVNGTVILLGVLEGLLVREVIVAARGVGRVEGRDERRTDVALASAA